jgi:hypothetical protein
MSLPTAVDLQTMDYAFLGQPFVNVPAKFGIDLKGMDYAFEGQPFVAPDMASSDAPRQSLTAIMVVAGFI